MKYPEPSIRVNVDVTNPGQFFACCGLLELADRLWSGAEGWFESGAFHIACGGTLGQLLNSLYAAKLEQVDLDDDTTSPLRLPLPRPLVLDWWHDERSGGSAFKTWAGRQQVVAIACAMHGAIPRAVPLGPNVLLFAERLPDPNDPKKAVVPFYFDARRAAGATNLDLGFSPDVQGIDVQSFPVVELLCLIALQRFRPAARAYRTFVYQTWSDPHPPHTAAAIACGALDLPNVHAFTFRLLYRTKYLKGFLPSTPIHSRGDQ